MSLTESSYFHQWSAAEYQMEMDILFQNQIGTKGVGCLQPAALPTWCIGCKIQTLVIRLPEWVKPDYDKMLWFILFSGTKEQMWANFEDIVIIIVIVIYPYVPDSQWQPALQPCCFQVVFLYIH